MKKEKEVLVVVGRPENNEENDTRAERENTEPKEQSASQNGFRSEGQDGFGSRGGGARAIEASNANEENQEKPRWWPSCVHSRWTKLDKTKFKDRIVWLKECRRCGKKKTEVVYRDLNSRQVYTARDVFAVLYRQQVDRDLE